MTDKFGVGVSASIRPIGGQLLIPDDDLTPLTSDRCVQVTSLLDVGLPKCLAKDIADSDVVISMPEKAVGHPAVTEQSGIIQRQLQQRRVFN